jgi:hypothetical protein
MGRGLCLVEVGFVTGVAVHRESGKSVFVAIKALLAGVAAGKREIGLRMVEAPLLIAAGVTGKTGQAVILISLGLLVLIIRSGLGMLMTLDAGKYGIIALHFVAFGAIVPLP